jgi:hypothetical protein
MKTHLKKLFVALALLADTNGALLFQDPNAASFPNRCYRACWPLP